MTGVSIQINSATPAELQQFFAGLFGFATNQAAQLDRIEAILRRISIQENLILTDLTAITQQVRANTDAEAAAVQLLTHLSELLAAAGTDPVALEQLRTNLETSRGALAAAIVANTPAA